MSDARVGIVTDSTAYLPPELVEAYDIHVGAQMLILGEQVYRDGVDISARDFYRLLQTSKVVPKTSQLSVEEARQLLERAGEGKDGVVAIVISGALSGTYNSVMQAKALLPDMEIEIIDSRHTAMSLGFVVLAAARAAAEGQDLAEVVAVAKTTIPHVGVMLVAETLEYLHRGGRIGGAQKLLGTALNLKPVLELRGGVVEPVKRIRTKRKALQYILDELAQRLHGKHNIRLAALSALADAEAQMLLEEAKGRVGGVVEAYVLEASPIVCAHIGPGAVGMAWCDTV